jgi:hypothetical protein
MITTTGHIKSYDDNATLQNNLQAVRFASPRNFYLNLNVNVDTTVRDEIKE